MWMVKVKDGEVGVRVRRAVRGKMRGSEERDSKGEV